LLQNSCTYLDVSKGKVGIKAFSGLGAAIFTFFLGNLAADSGAALDLL